ncbi:MAG TPA: FixG Ig-like domain-containing protein [Nitrospirota bacterium]|nr:FixG Ig-like domain-containing protein [Nitrospirota bacterium]
MAGRGRKSLIDYTFGLPDKRGTGIRINPLLTGALTASSFVFLMYLAFTRVPFDMNVRLNYSGGPSVQTDGSVLNRYILSLRNLAATDLDLDLHVSASAGSVIVTPNTVKLKQGTDITTVPVLVTLQPSLSTGQRPVTVIFTLQEKRLDKRIVKSVFFVLPKEK